MDMTTVVWRRGLAGLIDLTIMSVPVLIEMTLHVVQSPVIGLVNVLFVVGYYSGMEITLGATVGKLVLGLRVRDNRDAGKLPRFLLRGVSRVFCLLAPVFWLQGILCIWTKDERSFVDIISCCTVVDATSEEPPPHPHLAVKLISTVLILGLPVVLLRLFLYVILLTQMSRC